MKIKLVWMIAAAALMASAADYVNLAGTIVGTNSFSAAAYCGAGSVGNFTTAVGNNAFRASEQDNGVAVGSMALSASRGGNFNTMLGAWAGFGSTNMNNCVGIGAGAFMGATSMTNATSINGQFVARGDLNRFWIAADKRSTADWDGCPPIFYDDGVLYLNARTIVKRDGVIEKTAPLHTTDWTSAVGGAIYVARYGRDEYDGKSMYYPKRTIQAALEALEDDSTIVYVGEGEYTSPQYLNRNETAVEHRVHIVGVGKPGDVVIDCGGTRKIDAGKSGMVALFKNVTFKDVATPNSGLSDGHRGAFQLFYLYNCRVIGSMTVRNSYWPFCAGYLEGCEIDVNLSTDGTVANYSLGYGTIFSDVNLFDCTAKFADATPANTPANMAYGLYAENCYFDFARLYDYRITKVHALNVPTGGMIDCTMIVKNGSYASSIQNSNGTIRNLVYGLNNTVPTFAAASFTASAEDLLARLDPETHKPQITDFDIVPFGFNSAEERARRDGASLAVMQIMEASGTLTAAQGAALMSARPVLLARNVPSSVIRSRNASTVVETERDE